MGGHSKTRVEIKSEDADNGHHTIQKLSYNLCCLFVRTGWSFGENMSFPHKEKHTCNISVSSLWGNVCVEDDPVGKQSFPHKEKRTSDTSDIYIEFLEQSRRHIVIVPGPTD